MYWRDHDITYQADDVSWAGLRPASDSAELSVAEFGHMESGVYGGETFAPVLTSEKSVGLFGKETVTPHISFPLAEISYLAQVADALRVVAAADVPVLKLTAALVIRPAVVGPVYVESETAARDTLYPVALDVLMPASVYLDEALPVTVESFYPVAQFYGEDSLQPDVAGAGTPIILSDTVLKFRSSTAWESTAVIKIKQSDGAWQQKPIYMKQLDQSWM